VIRLLITLVVISLGTACSKPAKGTAPEYFNLTAYFDAEISRLEAQKTRVSKTVTINGKTETLQADSLNYRSALQIFLDADINKSAWKGRFKVDKNQQQVRFTTTDKDIPVKSLTIQYQDDTPEIITIERYSYAMLAGATHHMRYHRNRGFTVVTTQHALLREDKIIRVEFRFNP